MLINFNKLHLVQADQTATEPVRPIKRKGTLVVVPGIVLGGMLDVFAALIRSMIHKRRS